MNKFVYPEVNRINHNVFSRYSAHLLEGGQHFQHKLAAMAQMVACLPLVQQVRGAIPGGVVNFNFKFFNLGARMGGDVHFLITRLYITVLD